MVFARSGARALPRGSVPERVSRQQPGTSCVRRRTAAWTNCRGSFHGNSVGVIGNVGTSRTVDRSSSRFYGMHKGLESLNNSRHTRRSSFLEKKRSKKTTNQPSTNREAKREKSPICKKNKKNIELTAIPNGLMTLEGVTSHFQNPTAIVKSSGGRRRLDRAMDRWVRERKRRVYIGRVDRH